MATTAPSAQALRAMMAMAAATASAAAGDASQVVLTPTAPSRSRPSARPNANRRQSINQLQAHLESTPLPKGAPLPSAADGDRSRRIAAVAAEIASKWVHPADSSQYETDVLHQVRAILYMNKSLITQSFVSHVSGVSQGSLSHYVRGLFRGNQQNIEDRLGSFIRKFASGELDTFLEEARSGSRPLRAVIYDSNAAAAAAASGTPASNTPNTIILPPPPPDPRPPVPPPPPPQLLPAPWTRPPPPPQPPRPLSQPETPPRPNGLPPRTPEFSPAAMTERALRARQRQVAQRKRERTAFVAALEDGAESSPVDAVDRAYHALVAPNWTTDPTHPESLLLPVELFVEIGDTVLHMFTQWDINERMRSPEFIADSLRKTRGLPVEFAAPAAMQIRRALFEAGVVCPPPPAAANAENRRLIRINVGFGEGGETQRLRDEFEWDLGIGALNSPELFAHCLCSDAGIPQKYAGSVASAIREKLVCAHAIAYGDEETKQAALKDLPADDPLRNPLPAVASAFAKHPEHERMSRDLNEADIADTFVSPLIDAVITEAQNRIEERARKIKEEAERKEYEAMRAADEADSAARQAKIEEALQEVESAAIQLQKERGLDFRPYLALKLGRGERPGVWTPGVFDRKRRRQTSFPMTAPSRVHMTNLVQLGPRSSRRRRTSRREDPVESGSGVHEEDKGASSMSSKRQVKREADGNNSEVQEEVTQTIIDGQDVRIRVLLRIRPEKKKDSRSGSHSKKRRRR